MLKHRNEASYNISGQIEIRAHFAAADPAIPAVPNAVAAEPAPAKRVTLQPQLTWHLSGT
jgi:hypothetical protein